MEWGASRDMGHLEGSEPGCPTIRRPTGSGNPRDASFREAVAGDWWCTARGTAGLASVDAMAPNIATNTEVGLDELTRQMAGGDELTELSHELKR